jgi:ABC-type nickel/cobalt efflux system permease component RcnA
VRFWRPLQPKEFSQLFIDAVLFGIYGMLAFSVGRGIDFSFFATLLFIVATTKYAFMLEKTPHSRTIKRKILIDLAGALLCAAALLGTLMGYAEFSAMALAAVFAGANVYLLWHKPMYRLL